jgi:hypothetical protein
LFLSSFLQFHVLFSHYCFEKLTRLWETKFNLRLHRQLEFNVRSHWEVVKSWRICAPRGVENQTILAKAHWTNKWIQWPKDKGESNI